MTDLLLRINAILLLVAIGLRVTKRVNVAWLTYFRLRRDPQFQSPEARAWLWQRTLDVADGRARYETRDGEEDRDS